MKKGDIVYYIYPKQIFTNIIEWDYTWGEIEEIEDGIVTLNKLFPYDTTCINGVSVYDLEVTDWVEIPRKYQDIPPHHVDWRLHVIPELFNITQKHYNAEKFKEWQKQYKEMFDDMTDLEKVKTIRDYGEVITRHSPVDFHKSYTYEILENKIRIVPTWIYTEDNGYTCRHWVDVFSSEEKIDREIKKRNEEWSEWGAYVDSFNEETLCEPWDIKGVIDQYCKMFPHKNKDGIIKALYYVTLPEPARLLLRIWGDQLQYKHYLPPRAIYEWDCGYTEEDNEIMKWKNL